jgi:hypothetical protein
MLWTTIEPELTRPSSCKIAELYIERSRECNISVTLRGVPRKYQDPTDVDPQLLGLMSSHSYRIQRLTIVADEYVLDEIMAPFHHTSAATLEYLELKVVPFYGYEGPLKMFASGAPLLRSLKLSHFPPLDSSILPWLGSIVALDFTNSHLVPRMMTACPLLQHLTVDSDTCKVDPIETPSLTSLKLLFENGESEETDMALAEVLGNFTRTPALTNLTARPVHGDQIPFLFDSTALGRACFPALTSLIFVGSRCPCPNRPACIPKTISSLPLQTFPALSSLSIIDVCYAANIIRDILGATVPWPLRTVIIGTEKRLHHVEGLYEVLKGAVSAARQQKREIPTFWLSPSLFRLSYWQENGVDVELFDGMETTGG